MKIKILLLSTVCFLNIHFAQAQTQPLINCGLQYSYDAAGNRILRATIPCAQNGSNTGGSHNSMKTNRDTSAVTTDSTVLATFQIVMIAPNPTAGPFTIACNQDLNNASVTIVDMNGQTVSQFTANGRSIPMDISKLSSGSYTVTVRSNGVPTSATLIKMSGH
jgi:hypothetical protein